MRFDKRSVMVTGAAGHLGRAVAKAFADAGANLVLVDVRDDKENRGDQAVFLKADLLDAQSVQRAVAEAVERFGRIDVLHNNAGISGGAGDVFAYTPDDWDRILNVNLKSAFFLSQKVARVMIDRGQGGRILNTASIAAFIAASRPTIPYDISKAGLRQMTVSLAAYLGRHGITVNAIAPGTIDTELSTGLMSAEQFNAFRQRRLTQTPLGRLGQPEDLVGAAIFLCSDEAAYVTGHTLVVDGGLLTV
jgi:gluconate 5-dehydrogenase